MSTQNQNSNNQPQQSKAEKEAEAAKAEALAAKEAYENKLKDLEEKEAAEKEKAEKEAEAAKAEEDRIIAEKKELDAKAAAEAAKPWKLKHNGEVYEYPASEKKNFIVRHSRMFKAPSGEEMEDPGSIRIQIYRPEVYADLIHENEKVGKRNAFVQGGEKTIVLHDPTK
ncbi:hypothetical protein [Pedobacter zeae]|uniref:Putative membrane protein YqiK n=1 Tax=Pedobacter zeae TaxID=1737356 RepID=A0A7W6P5E2_9SPHI|nr:hypothetical protein [Pedobacter zeae]MBB4107738.1 putative membrane protein YqiK [Pedobacter zeae]GGG97389.1 hypothetical protein GCM10007422_09160 [Pedobacter zeae]